jgi:transcriptional antiterminator RfaH
MALRWYLIRTKPRNEYRAAAALSREGSETFFPCVRKPRPQGGYSEGPLFPSYLFIKCDWERGEGPSVYQLPGILGWVRFDGAVIPVPDDVIWALARRVETINEGGGLWTKFQPGDRVRVSSGELESFARVVEEPTSPHSRVRILLEFMGRLVPTKVPVHTLRRLGQSNLANDHPRPRRTRGRGRWVRGFGPQAALTV